MEGSNDAWLADRLERLRLGRENYVLAQRIRVALERGIKSNR
jgi:hypothetical protein